MELNCRYFVITEIKPVSHAVCAWLCNIVLFCFELHLPPVHLPVFIVMSLNVCLMVSLLNSGFLTGIEDLDFVLVCLYVVITIHLPIIHPGFCHRELWSPPNRPDCFKPPWLFSYTRVFFFFFCPKCPFLLYSRKLQSSLKIQLKLSVQKLSFLLPGRTNDAFPMRSHHILNLFLFVYIAGVINICLHLCLSFY